MKNILLFLGMIWGVSLFGQTEIVKWTNTCHGNSANSSASHITSGSATYETFQPDASGGGLQSPGVACYECIQSNGFSLGQIRNGTLADDAMPTATFPITFNSDGNISKIIFDLFLRTNNTNYHNYQNYVLKINGNQVANGSVDRDFTTITLTNPIQFNSGQVANVTLVFSDGNTFDPPPSISCTNESAPYGAITFRSFEIQSASIAPIVLKDFSGKLIEDKVELKWITMEGFNNGKMEIQQSTDAINYRTIAKVENQALDGESDHYSYQAKFLPAKHNYFRIKQLDENGDLTYSSTLRIKGYKFLDEDLVKIYQKSHDDLAIETKDFYGNCLLRDLNGRLITQKKLTGNRINSIDISELYTGIYIIQLQNENGVISKKFFKR